MDFIADSVDDTLGAVCETFAVRLKGLGRAITPIVMIVYAAVLVKIAADGLLSAKIGIKNPEQWGLPMFAVGVVLYTSIFWMMCIKADSKCNIRKLGITNRVLAIIAYVAALLNAITYIFLGIEWAIVNVIMNTVLMYVGLFVTRFWFDVVVFKGSRYMIYKGSREAQGFGWIIEIGELSARCLVRMGNHNKRFEQNQRDMGNALFEVRGTDLEGKENTIERRVMVDFVGYVSIQDANVAAALNKIIETNGCATIGSDVKVTEVE